MAAIGKALYPRAWLVLAVLAGAMLALAGLNCCTQHQEEGALEVGAKGIASSFSTAFAGASSVEDLDASAQVFPDEALGSYSQEVPADIAAEALSAEGALCSAASGGATLGFTRQGSAAENFAWAQGELGRKGWSFVPSGNNVAGTFVKGQGKYRWAALTCTEVGSGSSIVLTVSEVGTNG